MPGSFVRMVRQLNARSAVENAARDGHLAGVPRAIVLTTVGSVAKLFTSLLSFTTVQNLETLTELIKSRPKGTPLLTVSNHMSTLDDPLMWGLPGISALDHKVLRWILTAEDICFTNPVFSYFFRLGKCIPVTRGGGIYQPAMSEALDRLNEGEWLHSFPQGKVMQDDVALPRLKWGVGRLIARAAVPPIVLPLAHSGFERVMPEEYMFGRRPLIPLCFKRISIVVGEPMHFDIPHLMHMAEAASVSGTGFTSSTSKASKRRVANCFSAADGQVESPIPSGFSRTFHASLRTQSQYPVSEDAAALDEPAMRWLYSHVTDRIRVVLQELVDKAKEVNEQKRR